MSPADARLIQNIQQATKSSREVLVKLGRRGKALERVQPVRAALLLTAVRPHPFYKAGRLAFDMLEMEDLILGGPPVDPINQHDLVGMLIAVAGRWLDFAAALQRLGSDRRNGESAPVTAETDRPAPLLPRVRLGPEEAVEATEPDPELISSDYLYDFVVLGFLDLLGGAAETSQPITESASLFRPR
ncbi:MAG TPA: hypothetical protein VGU71_13290 [Candidatus Dormibacteraeota bacterium]|nr:hypothetical protein [Candidatus Dormibacteraeota bacterium]